MTFYLYFTMHQERIQEKEIFLLVRRKRNFSELNFLESFLIQVFL